MEKVFDCTNEEYILIRQDIEDVVPFDNLSILTTFVMILLEAKLEDGCYRGIKYNRGQLVVDEDYFDKKWLRPIKNHGYIDYKKVTRNKRNYLIITVNNFEQKAEDYQEDGKMD